LPGWIATVGLRSFFIPYPPAAQQFTEALRDELRWLSERQMMPGQPTPLIDYTESLIKWQQVRVEILEAIQDPEIEQAIQRAQPSQAQSKGMDMKYSF
jgi:hypothetical protein